MTETTATRPRHRRRKEARPPEIIEAAFIEFTENGFAACRLDDVAARAGVVKGTIYRYFDGKERLFEAVLLSRFTPILDAMQRQLEDHQGPVAPVLRAFVEKLYAEIAAGELPRLMRIIVAEGSRFPDILAFYHREAIAKAMGMLRTLLARGQAGGEFRIADEVGDMPLALMAPAIASALWSVTFQPHQPLNLAAMKAAHLAMLGDVLNDRMDR